MNRRTKSEILTWYDHSGCSQVGQATREAIARSRRRADRAFFEALEPAVWTDIQHLRCDSPASSFEALAALAMVGRDRSDEEAEAALLILGGGTLVATFEALTTISRCEVVERIVRGVAEAGVVGGFGQACLDRAVDLAAWGCDDSLAAQVPMFVSTLLEVLSVENYAAVTLALAALKSFATVHAVPSPSDHVRLVNAIRTPASDVDEAALGEFLLKMAEGECFVRLAYFAAQTRHNGLLSEFVRIAPPSAIAWLHEQLDSLSLGARGPVAIA